MPREVNGLLSAKGFKFALIASRWNDFVVSRLIAGAVDALTRLGAAEEDLTIYRVPGSFEIPLTCKKLAESGKYDAIVCLGAIIRGETPHFDYIAAEVTKGIAQVSLDTGIPVTYGVITADTVEQAIDRAGMKAGNKGFEAAMSAVELVNLYLKL
ncbi:MAG: 6,7-dimethyl-8-ribityllumazine synthase [Acidobacteriota bacterium]|nr:6,7-dimethyl-8-ribityllumazine synthase [Blastocatellia bacterium]MDW8411101.1 6,7-dimethyl-8-ribityllumazine synthase [Acidobacteriota bacterium]